MYTHPTQRIAIETQSTDVPNELPLRYTAQRKKPRNCKNVEQNWVIVQTLMCRLRIIKTGRGEGENAPSLSTLRTPANNTPRTPHNTHKTHCSCNSYTQKHAHSISTQVTVTPLPFPFPKHHKRNARAHLTRCTHTHTHTHTNTHKHTHTRVLLPVGGHGSLRAGAPPLLLFVPHVRRVSGRHTLPPVAVCCACVHCVLLCTHLAARGGTHVARRHVCQGWVWTRGVCVCVYVCMCCVVL